MKKVLLFMWLGDEKPSYTQWTLNNFKTMNPEWEIRFVQYSTNQIINQRNTIDPILAKIIDESSIDKLNNENQWKLKLSEKYRFAYLGNHFEEFIIYCDLDCFPIAPLDNFIYDGFPTPNVDWYKFNCDNKAEISSIGMFSGWFSKTLFKSDIWCISNNNAITVNPLIQIHKDTRMGEEILLHEGLLMNKSSIPLFEEYRKNFYEQKLELGQSFCHSALTPIEHYRISGLK